MFRGKLKAVSGIQIKYYDKFGREELIGKLKSIGNTLITYYDRFDGDAKMGRVKSIKGKTPNVNISATYGLAIDNNLSK